ncbi:MAG: hypothetical protein NTZ15_17050 [Burkholderiales bacterium]|nr:hypothetical protein [Burkholderiales bacterium]
MFYRSVLGIGFPWQSNVGRPQQNMHIPSTLTKDEVAGGAANPLDQLELTR